MSDNSKAVTVASTTDSVKAIEAVAAGEIVREQGRSESYYEDPQSDRQALLDRLAEAEREAEQLEEGVAVVTNKRSLRDPEGGELEPEPEAAQSETEGEPEQQAEPEAQPTQEETIQAEVERRVEERRLQGLHQEFIAKINKRPDVAAISSALKTNELAKEPLPLEIARLLIESPTGPQTAVHLAQNPGVLRELLNTYQKSPFLAVEQLGRIGSRVKAVSMSKAPAVKTPVRGSARPMTKSVYDNMPYAEYEAIREQQIKRRYKGR